MVLAADTRRSPDLLLKLGSIVWLWTFSAAHFLYDPDEILGDCIRWVQVGSDACFIRRFADSPRCFSDRTTSQSHVGTDEATPAFEQLVVASRLRFTQGRGDQQRFIGGFDPRR
jgi:hypothetical protein